MTQKDLALVGATSSLLALCVFYILTVIASWKIFQKAGIAGWKSLIPVYNLYLIYKIAGMSGWWAVPYYLTLGLASLWQNQQSMPQWAAICILIFAIISIIGQIIKAFKLPKVFGKGIGYSIVSIFFPRIVELILGFGSSEYVGDYSEK